MKIAIETPTSAKFESKNKNGQQSFYFLLFQTSDVEQLKENSKTKILWKQHRPGWKFGRIGWQIGKSTRKLKRISLKSLIKCCKYFIPKYDCWKYNKQKIAQTCSCISWFMVDHDVLKFSNHICFSSCNFEDFKTSLVPINQEIHSRSCNFLYLRSAAMHLLIWFHQNLNKMWESWHLSISNLRDWEQNYHVLFAPINS